MRNSFWKLCQEAAFVRIEQFIADTKYSTWRNLSWSWTRLDARRAASCDNFLEKIRRR